MLVNIPQFPSLLVFRFPRSPRRQGVGGTPPTTAAAAGSRRAGKSAAGSGSDGGRRGGGSKVEFGKEKLNRMRTKKPKNGKVVMNLEVENESSSERSLERVLRCQI